MRKFLWSLFSKSSDLSLKGEKVFFAVFGRYFPLDPDPDPGGQKLADGTDPDPKHCLKALPNKYELAVCLKFCKLIIFNCVSQQKQAHFCYRKKKIISILENRHNLPQN